MQLDLFLIVGVLQGNTFRPTSPTKAVNHVERRLVISPGLDEDCIQWWGQGGYDALEERAIL